MSRPLAPGDLAVILIDNIQYSLPIISTSPDRIITEDYVLIPTVDGWQVQDYNMSHTINFQAAYKEQLLSGVEDVDRLILLDLDYRSLLAACTSDPFTNKICRDDFFWRQKVEKDMGQQVLINKLPGMSYREQYRTLVSGMDEKMAIINGRLDYLIWKNVSPNDFAAFTAAELGWINILEWARVHGLPLDHNVANKAAVAGKIDVLEWLHEKDIYPDDDGFINAVDSGRKKSIKWMLDHDIIPQHPEQAANSAIYGNEPHNIEMLELLATHEILPDANGANYAALDGNVSTLEWLYQRNIYPNDDGIFEAVDNDYYHVVRWLLDRGIVHSRPGYMAELAIFKGNFAMLNLLETYRILPSKEEAKNAITQLNNGLSKWLADRGIYKYSVRDDETD